MIKQKTTLLTNETRTPKWYIVDASQKVVGRLATEVARVLKGKNNSSYTSHIDSGDHVIIVNCEKVLFTGRKWTQKRYFWHSNHIGGIKNRTAKEQLARHPELILFEAIKGMMPKTTLGREQLTKLRIFKGESHPHHAQKPEALSL